MSTIAVYLPAIEEHCLDELVRRSQLPRNQVIRLGVRSLFQYAAMNGFDHLAEKLAADARAAAEAPPGS